MKIGKTKYTGKHVSAKAETAAPSSSSAKPAAEEKPAKVQPVKAPAAKPARRSAEAKQPAPKAECAARAPLPKGVKIAGIVLAVLILIVGSGALFVNSKLNRLNRSGDAGAAVPADGVTVVSDDFAANVDGLEVRSGGGELPDGDVFSDKNIVNILLLGTDMKIPGTDDLGRCDCTMICSLNKSTGEVKLVGFERAIGVPIPGYEDELLTYAYQYGAGPFMVETIEKCFNVDLAGYVHVGFESFPQVINAIGGIDVELDQSEIYNLSVTYQYSPDLHEMSPGMNHLEGEVAYGYCRLRDSDDDWARQGRTREAVQAMVNKLKTLSITDLNKLMNEVLPLIETDLTNAQLTSLMMSAPKFVNATVTQLMEPAKDKTWSYQTGRGAFMIGCDFKECAAEIQEFIYGK